MYYAMCKHWKSYGPPVYMAVAGFLGLINTSKAKPKSGNLEDLERMFASTGGMI